MAGRAGSTGFRHRPAATATANFSMKVCELGLELKVRGVEVWSHFFFTTFFSSVVQDRSGGFPNRPAPPPRRRLQQSFNVPLAPDTHEVLQTRATTCPVAAGSPFTSEAGCFRDGPGDAPDGLRGPFGACFGARRAPLQRLRARAPVNGPQKTHWLSARARNPTLRAQRAARFGPKTLILERIF